MAKIESTVVIEWLSGNDNYDEKALKDIKERINKDRNKLFSIIKWGGSTFDCWEKADNPADAENLSNKEYINKCDFGWDNEKVLNRFLSVISYGINDINEMIESVNDGTRPNMLSTLLEIKNGMSNQPKNELEDVKVSLTKTEAKETWKFQMDNALGGYKITGLTPKYCRGEKYLIMPSFIDDVPVVSISDKAFQRCDFESMKLSDNLKVIGHSVFQGNNSLTEVRFPDNIEELPKSLFRLCDNLKRVELPKNIRKISPWTFGPKILEAVTPGQALPSLEEIWIDPSNEFYNTDHGVLIDKKKHVILFFPATIEEYRIPEDVKELPGFVFAGSQLKHIYVHDKVESMDDELFTAAIDDPFDDRIPLQDLVIHAPVGSYAIEYAKEHGIKYTEE